MTLHVFRPLGVGQLLDAAVKITVRRFRPLLLAGLVVAGPVMLAAAFAQAAFRPDTNAIVITTDPANPTINSHELSLLLASTGAAVVLNLLAARLAVATSIELVCGAYLGTEPDWRRSLRAALRQLRPLLVIAALVMIAFTGGLVLCILPAVYFLISFELDVPVLLVEGQRGTAALGRSKALLEGRWWRTLGIIVLTSIIAGVVGGVASLLLTIPATSLDTGVLSVVLTALGTFGGGLLTMPFTACVTILLYLDARSRKDGCDLAQVAAALGVQEPVGGFLGSDLPGLAPGGTGVVWPPPQWPPPQWPPAQDGSPPTGAPVWSPTWAPAPAVPQPGVSQPAVSQPLPDAPAEPSLPEPRKVPRRSLSDDQPRWWQTPPGDPDVAPPVVTSASPPPPPPSPSSSPPPPDQMRPDQ